jgi:bifunctional N-acetylglucosamine-1-phosphate-uridyltransferase/glucosamine-1-phosphate-acetyltransferase GlmU-like protein
MALSVLKDSKLQFAGGKMEFAATVLAGGYGKIGGKSKLLADINGTSMIRLVTEKLCALPFRRIYVLVNTEPDSGEKVKRELEDFPNLEFVEQPHRCGSAGATRLVLNAMRPEHGARHLLITYGDMPLWETGTFELVMKHHLEKQPQLTMVSIPLVKGSKPERYGRILRDAQGRIKGTIEPWQIEPGQTVEADEVNPSLYAASVQWLKVTLPRLRPVNKKDGWPDEYLLQDTIHIASQDNAHVAEVRVDDVEQALGVNEERELEEVASVVTKRRAARKRLVA